MMSKIQHLNLISSILLLLWSFWMFVSISFTRSFFWFGLQYNLLFGSVYGAFTATLCFNVIAFARKNSTSLYLIGTLGSLTFFIANFVAVLILFYPPTDSRLLSGGLPGALSFLCFLNAIPTFPITTVVFFTSLFCYFENFKNVDVAVADDLDGKGLSMVLLQAILILKTKSENFVNLCFNLMMILSITLMFSYCSIVLWEKLQIALILPILFSVLVIVFAATNIYLSFKPQQKKLYFIGISGYILCGITILAFFSCAIVQSTAEQFFADQPSFLYGAGVFINVVLAIITSIRSYQHFQTSNEASLTVVTINKEPNSINITLENEEILTEKY